MRIIYIHQYFNTPAMAGGTRSYEMAKRLVASGHEVHMITSFRDECEAKNWFYTVEDGVHVHWLPIFYSNILNYNQRIKTFIKFAYASAKKAASIPADVIFATSTPLTIALPAVYAARCQKIPMVFEVRDLWPELPIAIGALKNPLAKYAARRLERFAYKNAKRIIALSPGMATGVKKTGYPAHHISIIPNSCDLDLFQPNQKQATHFRTEHVELGERPIILYPGTLGKINGVGWLVRLAARLQTLGSDCCFVIVGAGVEWNDVQTLASEQGVLGKNFFIYPQMPKQKLVAAFSAASVIVSLFIDLPAMEANSANKFFDALASGTAIAINYGGWQADLIKKYGVGLTLSRNINSAADSLLDFLSDQEKILEYGDNGRKLAVSHYSRDDLAKKLEKVLINAIQ